MKKIQCDCGASSFEQIGNGLVRCTYCRSVYDSGKFAVVKTGETVVASFDNPYDWAVVEETYTIKAEDAKQDAEWQAMLDKREEQGKWVGYGCLWLIPLAIVAAIEIGLYGFPFAAFAIFVVGGLIARKKIKQHS